MIKSWDKKQILALTHYKGLRYDKIRQIIEHFNSMDEFLSSPKKTMYHNGFNESIFNDDSEINIGLSEKQLELADKNNSEIVTIYDESYPYFLSQIHNAPVIIYVKGKLNKSDSVSIAIVGTRNNTTYGQLNAERFSSHFARNNLIVTSGMAYGIDTYAHLAAVKAGGPTYAVIASGLDKIAGSIAKKNADRIVESGGAVISEYKFGTKTIPAYFPQRNRIISGISRATLIIESGRRGGSLITARFAIDQSRELFAIPGNITSDKSIGCNELIEQGASPALSPERMLKLLGLKDDPAQLKLSSPQLKSKEEKLIWNNLSFDPVHIDQIADITNIDISTLLVKLLELEFRGVIRQLPGKNYIKVD